METGDADAVLTQPPESATAAHWQRALGCVRPGGTLLAQGTPKAYHHLGVAVEDGGWEISDCLAWFFTTGMPPSPTRLKPAWAPILVAHKPGGPFYLGAEDGGVPYESEKDRVSSAAKNQSPKKKRWPPNVAGEEGLLPNQRFFSCPKPSAREKREGGSAAPKGFATMPLALARWLIRLSVPPGGLVLDPFAGTATTACAAILETRRSMSWEKDEQLWAVGQSRIRYWRRQRG